MVLWGSRSRQSESQDLRQGGEKHRNAQTKGGRPAPNERETGEGTQYRSLENVYSEAGVYGEKKIAVQTQGKKPHRVTLKKKKVSKEEVFDRFSTKRESVWRQGLIGHVESPEDEKRPRLDNRKGQSAGEGETAS